jgi:hypothetical protein
MLRHRIKSRLENFFVLFKLREPLARHARVNGHLGRLPAKRTHNGFANFHAQNLTALGQSAMVQLCESFLDNRKTDV